MKLCIVFIIFSCGVVYGQWADRVYLVEAVDYFHRVMQETVLQLEERGFSTLRLNDTTQTIDQEMYKWHVEGDVTYTNGYLVSIEKLDVTDVREQPSMGTVQGFLNFRDFKIGYDVLAQLGEDGDHRFTGTYVHTRAAFQFWIQKNLTTQQITVSHSLDSLTAGVTGARMIYMPENNITQVLSRTYTPSNIFDSVSINWGRDVIVPIVLDIVTNKIEFPRVCLDCR